MILSPSAISDAILTHYIFPHTKSIESKYRVIWCTIRPILPSTPHLLPPESGGSHTARPSLQRPRTDSYGSGSGQQHRRRRCWTWRWAVRVWSCITTGWSHFQRLCRTTTLAESPLQAMTLKMMTCIGRGSLCHLVTARFLSLDGSSVKPFPSYFRRGFQCTGLARVVHQLFLPRHFDSRNLQSS